MNSSPASHAGTPTRALAPRSDRGNPSRTLALQSCGQQYAAPRPLKGRRGEKTLQRTRRLPLNSSNFYITHRSLCSRPQAAALKRAATQLEDQAACGCRRLGGGLIYMQHVPVLRPLWYRNWAQATLPDSACCVPHGWVLSGFADGELCGVVA